MKRILFIMASLVTANAFTMGSPTLQHESASQNQTSIWQNLKKAAAVVKTDPKVSAKMGAAVGFSVATATLPVFAVIAALGEQELALKSTLVLFYLGLTLIYGWHAMEIYQSAKTDLQYIDKKNDCDGSAVGYRALCYNPDTDERELSAQA